jgi:type I restriction enzyme S subunit
MSWVEQPLEMIAKCELGKMLDKNKNKGEYEIYLSNVDVRWGYFEMDELKKMRFETREFERYSLNTGDIIMCEGGEAGRCAIWKNAKIKMMYQKALHRIRTKKNIDSGFLFYQFLNMGNNGKFEAYYTGATIKHLPLQILKKIPISIAPLQTQKRIADILSAYDDLIENNLKRIKLLEQAAQNIYKEWFVNLRFPGHEDTLINEETGLPLGWEEKEISSIVSFLGGYAFKSNTYIENGEYRVITIKNVGDKVFNTSVGNSVDSTPDKMKEHCKIIEGNILLSLTGNVGRSCIAYGVNNLLNQRVAKIVPTNKNWLPYIYWMFNDNKMFSLMNNLATGAAQQNLSPVKLAKEKVVIPSESIIELYCSKAKSVFKQIILLNKQNQKLKAARDILLPRLMNRTIEVE